MYVSMSITGKKYQLERFSPTLIKCPIYIHTGRQRNVTYIQLITYHTLYPKFGENKHMYVSRIGTYLKQIPYIDWSTELAHCLGVLYFRRNVHLKFIGIFPIENEGVSD